MTTIVSVITARILIAKTTTETLKTIGAFTKAIKFCIVRDVNQFSFPTLAHKMSYVSTKHIPYVLLIVSLVLSSCFLFIFGDTVGGDKPRYLDLGERVFSLLSGDLTLADMTLTSWDIFFLLPNILIYSGHVLFGEYFHQISIAINVTVFCWLISTTVKRLFSFSAIGNKLPLIGLGLIVYIFWGIPAEVVKYTYNAHSPDIIAMVIYGLVLLNCIQHYQQAKQNSKNKKHLIIACVLAAASVFTRPAGIVPLVIVAIAICWEFNWFKSRTSRITIFLIIPTLIAFVVWPWWAFYMATNHFDDVSFGLQLALFNYMDGSVLSERPETNIQNVNSALDYAWITVLRAGYYLVPLRGAFSISHFLANSAYVIFTLYFIASGWRYLMKKSQVEINILWLITLQAYYFALLHAMTQVDDWRYELPLWPSVWILSLFGIIHSYRKIAKR